jgi:hypothetical protein
MIDRKGIWLLALAACVASPAFAQTLPSWDPSEICRKDSSPGQCAAFEARARNAVSGSWGVLLDATKKTCLDAVKSPLDQSWRLLASCIDESTEANLVKQNAIATRLTPGEPIAPASTPASAAAPASTPAAPPGTLAPAASPAAASEGVPPPPFQLPTTAPQIQ